MCPVVMSISKEDYPASLGLWETREGVAPGLAWRESNLCQTCDKSSCRAETSLLKILVHEA